MIRIVDCQSGVATAHTLFSSLSRKMLVKKMQKRMRHRTRLTLGRTDREWNLKKTH